MRPHALRNLPLATLSLTGVLVASCSDGSSSPSPPAPPPTPVNQAPSIDLDASKNAPDEGQVFVIDASDSTDAEGDSLTFSIAQTGGPNAQQDPQGGPAGGPSTFVFRAPEVDADSEMTFEVTAHDGQNTSTQSATITARNIELTPLTTFSNSPPTTFETTTGHRGMFELDFTQLKGFYRRVVDEPDFYIEDWFVDEADDRPGMLDLQFISDTGGSSTNPRELVFDLEASVDSEVFLRSGSALGTFGQFLTMAVGLRGTDMVRVFWTETPPEYEIKDTISQPGLCSLALTPLQGQAADSYFGQGLTHFPDIVVGTEGQGFEVFINQGKAPASDAADAGMFPDEGVVFDDGETICHLESVWYSAPAAPIERDRALFAVNEPDQTFSLWQLVPGSGDDPEFEGTPQRTVGPVTIPVSSGAQIVAAHFISYADTTIGGDLQAFVAALVASDGGHDGTSEVVIMNWLPGEDPASDASVDVFSLPRGIPVDVTIVDAPPNGAARTPDVAVLLGSAPFISVYAGQNSPGSGMDLDFAHAGYFEIELGASRFSAWDDINVNYATIEYEAKAKVERYQTN